eukprot:TRINITY_DN6133_c0_g1_i10.p1 TRINITY_DN6133_c0_g1~~TRINITY_DN6133_c0_g1_i10.p1  ORF type:complete len:633 (-),score=117.87 TRINITY_DN6133_c0_g1_i10:26-1924(-)
MSLSLLTVSLPKNGAAKDRTNGRLAKSLPQKAKRPIKSEKSPIRTPKKTPVKEKDTSHLCLTSRTEAKGHSFGRSNKIDPFLELGFAIPHCEAPQSPLSPYDCYNLSDFVRSRPELQLKASERTPSVVDLNESVTEPEQASLQTEITEDKQEICKVTQYEQAKDNMFKRQRRSRADRVKSRTLLQCDTSHDVSPSMKSERAISPRFNCGEAQLSSTFQNYDPINREISLCINIPVEHAGNLDVNHGKEELSTPQNGGYSQHPDICSSTAEAFFIPDGLSFQGSIMNNNSYSNGFMDANKKGARYYNKRDSRQTTKSSTWTTPQAEAKKWEDSLGNRKVETLNMSKTKTTTTNEKKMNSSMRDTNGSKFRHSTKEEKFSRPFEKKGRSRAGATGEIRRDLPSTDRSIEPPVASELEPQNMSDINLIELMTGELFSNRSLDNPFLKGNLANNSNLLAALNNSKQSAGSIGDDQADLFSKIQNAVKEKSDKDKSQDLSKNMLELLQKSCKGGFSIDKSPVRKEASKSVSQKAVSSKILPAALRSPKNQAFLELRAVENKAAVKIQKFYRAYRNKVDAKNGPVHNINLGSLGSLKVTQDEFDSFLKELEHDDIFKQTSTIIFWFYFLQKKLLRNLS